MKKYLVMMTALLMVLTVLSGCSWVKWQEVEPNNVPKEAQSISFERNVNGAIRIDGDDMDIDWYFFTIDKMAEVEINVSFTSMVPNDTHWFIEVYEHDGVSGLYALTLTGNDDGSIDMGALEPGTYLVAVSGFHVYKDYLPYTIGLEKLHECDGKFVVEQEPTCTQDGQEWKWCETCETVIDVRLIPATGHKFGGWTVDSNATCVSNGSRHAICSECQETIVEEITEGEHSFGSYEVISGNIIIPPIVKERHCSLCGHTDVIKDWGYVWVTVLAAIMAIGVCVGIVSYFKAFKNN